MKEIEEWQSLDFMGYPDYEISTLGRVKSLKFGKEKIMKPNKNHDGYLFLKLSKNGKMKKFSVHKLVALSFIPNENPIEKTEINHIDENKENNCANNLCWITHKENCNYGTRNERVSKAHKGKPKSEEHKQKMSKARKGKPKSEEHKQKLSKSILQYTLSGEFIREFDSIKSASEELNLNKANICNCCKGKRKFAGGFIWKYK